MAHFIYHRASTTTQDFIQQQKCVTDYLGRLGIVADDTITEKVSGTISHKERKLSDLLASCQAGDVVYVSELSRLGRCMADLFAIVTEATDKGIKLVQCKDGSTIEAESIGGKALLFALSLAAEIEVANIRQRTQMAIDARKEMIKRDGGFVSKSGRWCTQLGGGNNIGEAVIAASKARTDARLAWEEQSEAFNLVAKRLEQGWSRAQILEDFAELYKLDTKRWCTRNGAQLSKGVLSKWCRMITESGRWIPMEQSERRNS